MAHRSALVGSVEHLVTGRRIRYFASVTIKGTPTILAGKPDAPLCPGLAKRQRSLKRIRSHSFRHTYSTLLRANSKDVKCVQGCYGTRTVRSTDGHVHAGPIASQADGPESRGTDVCREKEGGFGLTALIEPLSNPCLGHQIPISPLESGGDDGARTRDLCRDS